MISEHPRSLQGLAWETTLVVFCCVENHHRIATEPSEDANHALRIVLGIENEAKPLVRPKPVIHQIRNRQFCKMAFSAVLYSRNKVKCNFVNVKCQGGHFRATFYSPQKIIKCTDDLKKQPIPAWDCDTPHTYWDWGPWECSHPKLKYVWSITTACWCRVSPHQKWAKHWENHCYFVECLLCLCLGLQARLLGTKKRRKKSGNDQGKKAIICRNDAELIRSFLRPSRTKLSIKKIKPQWKT